MSTEEKPLFFVLYSAHHQRCGRFLERADSRLTTKEDIIRWSQEILSGKAPEILSLHCYTCSENIIATHLRIMVESNDTIRLVVPEIEIKKFNPAGLILP